MRVTNPGSDARTLSHQGKDHFLAPGTFVEVPLSADEAEALRGIAFGVTGEPIPAEPKDRKSRSDRETAAS